MASKGKPTTFCTIHRWLEVHDSALVDAIDGICAGHYLKPQGKSGITFLYPSERDYRAKIIAAQNGDSKAQEEAEDIIKSLVLGVNLPTAASFIAHKDIPNRLGNKVKATTSGNSVVLEGSVHIEPEPSFNARTDRNNMSVWKITKGNMPLTGEKSSFDPNESSKPKKLGGGRHPIKSRIAFAKFVEEKFRSYAAKGKLAECDPYLESLLSLLLWLRKYKNDMYRATLAMIGPQWRIEFYNVFQPYKSGNYFIDNGIFEQWQSETAGWCFLDKPADEYLNIFKELDSNEDDMCASAGGRDNIKKMRLEMRADLIKGSKRADLGPRIKDCYNKICSSNSYGQYTKILPAKLAEYYGSNSDIKFMQDATREVMGLAFRDIEDSLENVGLFLRSHEELCDTLRLTMNFNSISTYAIFNTAIQNSATAWYSGTFGFLRSTNLFFIGTPESEQNVAFLSDIPEPDDISEIDVIGHSWAKSREKARLMADEASKLGIDRFNSAKMALSLAAEYKKVGL